MNAQRVTSKCGFATMVAVWMIAMVAVATMAMSSRFADETRRTRDGTAAAQVRLLLLAGMSAVQQKLRSDDIPQDMTITLPDDLVARGGTLMVETEQVAGNTRAIRIEATFGPVRARQTVEIVRSAKGWKIKDTHLVSLHPMTQ